MAQTARRLALLPLCLVSVTALGACGAPSDGEATSTTTDTTAAATATATDSPSASATDSAAAMSTTGSTASTTLGPPAATGTGNVPAPTTTAAAPSATAAPPTVTVTVTATNGTAAPLPPAAGTPVPTASVTTGSSTDLATVPVSRLGSCHREKLVAYAMNLKGLNDKARQTAQTVYRASRVCIPANLIRVATRDSTRLAYEKTTPKQAFALPQTDRRYDTVLKLMGLQSATADVKGTNTYIWPRVIANPKDESAWQEVTDLGLITKDQAARMRKSGGYYGPQVWIDETGKWRVYTL